MKKIVYTLLIVLFLAAMIFLIKTHNPSEIIDLTDFDTGHYLALKEHNTNCEKYIEAPKTQQGPFLIIGPYTTSAISLKAHSKLQNCAKTIHIIAKT